MFWDNLTLMAEQDGRDSSGRIQIFFVIPFDQTKTLVLT